MKKLLPFLFPLLEVVIGFLLIVSPGGLVKGIVTTVGLGLIICGAANIIPYVRKSPDASRGRMIFGIVIAVIGLLMGLLCESFVSLFPTLAVLYGVGLLVTACARMPRLLNDMKNQRSSFPAYFLKIKMDGFGALLLAVLGTIALINPFGTVNFAFRLTAAALFVDAALSAAGLFLTEKAEQQFNTQTGETNKFNEKENADMNRNFALEPVIIGREEK